jgi:hypothetical protein
MESIQDPAREFGMEIEIAWFATVLRVSKMNILGSAGRDVSEIMDEPVNGPKLDGWAATLAAWEIFKFAFFKPDLCLGKIPCIFPSRTSIWGIFWTVHKTLLGEFPTKGYEYGNQKVS